MGYEAVAKEDPGALPGWEEGRGGRRGADEARRGAGVDRAAGQDPPRPRGLARLAGDHDPDRRPAEAAATGRGARARLGDERDPGPTDPTRRRSGDRHGRGQGRDVRPLPRRPRRGRDPGRAAGRRRLRARGPPLHDGVSLHFATRNAGKRGVVIDHTSAEGREQLLASARPRRHLDREREARRHVGARARRGCRPGSKRRAGRALDHRLRADRPVPRLGRDRAGCCWRWAVCSAGPGCRGASR